MPVVPDQAEGTGCCETLSDLTRENGTLHARHRLPLKLDQDHFLKNLFHQLLLVP